MIFQGGNIEYLLLIIKIKVSHYTHQKKKKREAISRVKSSNYHVVYFPTDIC